MKEFAALKMAPMVKSNLKRDVADEKIDGVLTTLPHVLREGYGEVSFLLLAFLVCVSPKIPFPHCDCLASRSNTS